MFKDVFGVTDGKGVYSLYDRLNRKYGLSPDGQLWYCFAKQSANSKEIEKVKRALMDEGWNEAIASR